MKHAVSENQTKELQGLELKNACFRILDTLVGRSYQRI